MADYLLDTYALTSLNRVVDGDTVDLTVTFTVSIRFRVIAHYDYTGRFRIVTIDTPERGRPGFTEAHHYTRNWISNRLADNVSLSVAIYRDPDNFGRYLADIYDPEGNSLSAALLHSGHAVPYTR